jgi:hypothetical protein
VYVVYYSKAYESRHAEGHFVPLQTEKKLVCGESKTRNRKWTRTRAAFMFVLRNGQSTYYTQECLAELVKLAFVDIMLGRPWHRWKDNIKLDLQEVGCGGVDQIELAEDRDR